MRLLTYLRRLASAWWGVVFHASTWFAHRFERDAGRRRAWLEPLAFACIVAAPSLGAGVFVDAWVTGVPADRAVARAMIALLISPVLALLGVLVTAALAHGVLRVMGVDRGRFGQTLSCVGFAAAPELFAIVPFVGPLVAGVWRLVLLAQSLQIAHGLRRYRAFIAVFAGPAWLVGIGLAFRLSLVDAYKVPAGSMIPTILPGDHLLVRRGPYDPERGDVMIFRYPEDPTTFFVKRVVGLAGDEVRML
ncbi:MAG: signal peptidase I, partial [Myxococcota bacterium]